MRRLYAYRSIRRAVRCGNNRIAIAQISRILVMASHEGDLFRRNYSTVKHFWRRSFWDGEHY